MEHEPLKQAPASILITVCGSAIPVYALTLYGDNGSSVVLSEHGSQRFWHRLDDAVDYIQANYEPVPIRLKFLTREE